MAASTLTQQARWVGTDREGFHVSATVMQPQAAPTTPRGARGRHRRSVAAVGATFALLLGLAATPDPATADEGDVSAAEVCSSGARTLSKPGDRVYPEMGNGGYVSKHTDLHIAYDTATNMFLPGTRAALRQTSTQCLTDFSLDFERTNANVNGPNMTVSSVQVNGVDVREADLDGLWKTIGLVPQRPFLFAGTVASNLRFGREEATDADLWHALEIAQGRDFVADMEGGLDGRIAQGGTNVSGGQRQRLAIARAIVHRPDILVFDDSFSALDLTTDARLRQALWRELPDVTKIVVAQRVSTITDADRIIVLDDGGMVGIGTHEELLETCETYRQIVESQLGVGAQA